MMTISDDEDFQQALRLQKAISYETISYSPTNLSMDALTKFNAYLDDTFKVIHDAEYVENWMVNFHSRLYRVQGTENTSNPYLLMGHLDVVPPGTYVRTYVRMLFSDSLQILVSVSS